MSSKPHREGCFFYRIKICFSEAATVEIIFFYPHTVCRQRDELSDKCNKKVPNASTTQDMHSNS